MASSLYLNLFRALNLDKNLKLFMQLKQFCSTYSTQWLFLLTITGRVQVNVVIPQELKMLCRESNEINGEKNIVCC